MACPACGAENPPDARFCNQCGARVAPSDEQPAAAPAATGEPQAAPKGGAANAWDLASIDVRPPSGTAPPQAVAASLGGGPGNTQEALAQAGLARRSGRRTGLWLALGGLALFGAGAGIAVLATGALRGGGEQESIRVDEIDLMDPTIPEGHPPPDGEVDLVTGVPPEVPPPPSPTSGDEPPPRRNAGRAHDHDRPPVTTVDFRSGSGQAGTADSPAPPANPAAAPPTRPARAARSAARHRGDSEHGAETPSRPTSSAAAAAGASERTEASERGSGTGSATSGAAAGTGTTASGGAAGGRDPAADRRRLQRAAGAGGLPTADERYAAQVRFVFRRYWAARARTCFSQATRNREQLSGKVVLRMTLAADGKVAQARPVSNTTGDEGIGRCLAHRARRWRFPPPPGGEATMVDLPLTAR